MNLRKQLAILFRRRLSDKENQSAVAEVDELKDITCLAGTLCAIITGWKSPDKTVTIKGICCDFEIPNDAPCPCACHTDDPEEWRERCKAYDAEWETSK